MRNAPWILALALALSGCGASIGTTSEETGGSGGSTGPTGPTGGDTTVDPPCTTCTAAGALVVDHRAVQGFSRIPAQWLDAAKALRIHFAHTSHGSQILSGLGKLQQRDARYAFAVRESTTEGLPSASGALRIYDGNGNGSTTYITPDLYWDGTSGLDATRRVAATGHYDLSMWSWCGQQSSNDTATVSRYLSAMSDLEARFPAMRFVLFTGHTDGTDTPATPGTLKHDNALVRTYAGAHGLVLFDFEDIESWSPDGATRHPTTTDACDWCAAWCTAHPGDCADLSDLSCAHSHPLNCVLKAKAYWWMMARLAGWDGN